MSDTMTSFAEIKDRVARSMCLTWGAAQGERMEARISQDDWNAIVKVIEFYAKHEHWMSLGEDGPQVLLVAHGDTAGVDGWAVAEGATPMSDNDSSAVPEDVLAVCPFCDARLRHIESWAKSFQPPRIYHEYQHPKNGCIAFDDKLWSFSDEPEPRAAFVAAWNRRAESPRIAELVAALRFYEGEAVAAAKHMANGKNPGALLSILTVLALDAGNRAARVLQPQEPSDATR